MTDRCSPRQVAMVMKQWPGCACTQSITHSHSLVTKIGNNVFQELDINSFSGHKYTWPHNLCPIESCTTKINGRLVGLGWEKEVIIKSTEHSGWPQWDLIDSDTLVWNRDLTIIHSWCYSSAICTSFPSSYFWPNVQSGSILKTYMNKNGVFSWYPIVFEYV